VTQPERGRLLLVGWASTTSAVDAGVPTWASQLLATTLSQAHQVTFPSTSVPLDAAEHSVAHSIGGFWRRLASHGPHTFSVVTTQRPAVIANAFDDPGFPWWLQAQRLLVSPQGSPPLQLSRADVMHMIDSPDASFKLFAASGVVAQLSAGVDGDVAALLTLVEHEEQTFITYLQESARSMNVAVQRLSESAFADRLAEATGDS
jgi:hypothetical protein